MPPGDRYDFFLSRRGSVAGIAREVAEILIGRGYSVITQDYDIPITANFVEAMHEAIKNARDLIVLFTRDYEDSPFTRKEFTNFEADRVNGAEERRVVILRCEDVPLRGLFAANVYQDLVGIDDPAERRERILAAAEGRSQALKPPPRPFVGVPPRLGDFTGRAGELDRLDGLLIGGPAAQAGAGASSAQLGRAVVQGMGGVGKTALVAEYAARYRDLYAGVWWCPAETRNGLVTSLAALAVELGAAAADEADVEKAARAALRRLAEQRATFLLIYDNVASPDDIADLLPASGARVVITSRFADWSGWAEEVPLDVLSPDEAAAFLDGRAGQRDPAGAALLAEALGRLPLALDHAAAYCKRTRIRFADYAAMVATTIPDRPRGASYPRSVGITFDLAIDEAAAQSPAAEALMAFLAHCAPERIPMSLVAGALPNAGDRVAAMLALTDLSLARFDPFEDGGEAVTVHRLVQAVGRARAEAKGGAADAAGRVVARLDALYPADGFDNPASWPLCAHLTPHLLARCERDTPPGDVTTATQAGLLDKAARFFHGRAAFARAKPLFERALAIREALAGAPADTAASLNNLGHLLQSQGDLAGARPLFTRALTICETALGPAHPMTAMSLNNLALLLQTQGDLQAARPLFERALATYEAALGAEHPSTVTSLNNLAGLLWLQGDPSGARPLFERALAIREKVLGEAHPQTAGSLNNLARVRQTEGDLAGARPLLTRALAIFERVLGPEHPDTGWTMHNLARLAQAQGDIAGARTLFDRALATLDQALGAAHPQTARTRSGLARLLLMTGQPAEARDLAEPALSTLLAALGPTHPWTADAARDLADALGAMGQAAAADAVRLRHGVAAA